MYSLGDPSKAEQLLHWSSTVKFHEIVAWMIRAERRCRQHNTAGETAGVPCPKLIDDDVA
jgi:hypothetical protein